MIWRAPALLAATMLAGAACGGGGPAEVPDGSDSGDAAVDSAGEVRDAAGDADDAQIEDAEEAKDAPDVGDGAVTDGDGDSGDAVPGEDLGDGAVTDGDGDEGDADLGATTAAQVCAQVAEALCEPASVCCASTPGGSGDACRASVRGQCEDAATAEETALAAGQAFVSQPALTECLAAYEAAGGECRVVDSATQSGVCRSIFQDAAKAGEPCESGVGDLRCAGGEGICFPEPTGTTCRLYAAPGQACAEAPCPPWLLCLPASGGLVCDAPRDVGGACTADVHCAPGLRCQDGLCAPGIAQGEACKKSFDCAEALVCDPLTERCAPGVASGGECLSLVQCADGLACVGLDVGMVCVPAGPDQGSDAPGLPGFLEPCTGECATGFACAEGPVAGRCEPSLCGALGGG
ncbi:MAG: hypothetical protein H6746_20375 [Deltaproteobacteria bacterium]|nr:hypothetical protein [Deltaproteobacteria bacterium]